MSFSSYLFVFKLVGFAKATLYANMACAGPSYDTHSQMMMMMMMMTMMNMIMIVMMVMMTREHLKPLLLQYTIGIMNATRGTGSSYSVMTPCYTYAMYMVYIHRIITNICAPYTP